MDIGILWFETSLLPFSNISGIWSKVTGNESENPSPHGPFWLWTRVDHDLNDDREPNDEFEYDDYEDDTESSIDHDWLEYDGEIYDETWDYVSEFSDT